MPSGQSSWNAVSARFVVEKAVKLSYALVLAMA